MKYIFLLLIVFASFSSLSAQVGVGLHHGYSYYENPSFICLNYEFLDRVKPEFRIGINRELDYLSFEGNVLVDILNKEEYEWYAGLGFRFVEELDNDQHIVVPIGLNIYPFDHKSFGFHIELAPLVGGEYNNRLRGTWGIRYRFNNQY